MPEDYMAGNFGQRMYDMEDQLKLKNWYLWLKFEDESGELWEEESHHDDMTENWMDVFRKNPMACNAKEEKLKSLLKV